MKPRTPKRKETHQSPNQEQIAGRAREIWEAAGRPVDRDLDNWLQAENELNWLSQRSATHTVQIHRRSR
jgi:hypothetical protein